MADERTYLDVRLEMLACLHDRDFAYVIAPKGYYKTDVLLECMILDIQEAVRRGRHPIVIYVGPTRYRAGRGKRRFNLKLEALAKTNVGPTQMPLSFPKDADVTWCAASDIAKHTRGIEEDGLLYFDDVDEYPRETYRALYEAVIPCWELMRTRGCDMLKARFISRTPCPSSDERDKLGRIMKIMNTGRQGECTMVVDAASCPVLPPWGQTIASVSVPAWECTTVTASMIYPTEPAPDAQD